MKHLKSFLKLWTEFWSIPLALVSWFLSPFLLRVIDPTAGAYDAGVFQVILFAMIAMLMFNGAVWLGIKFNFWTAFSYYQSKFHLDFNSLEPWQKIKILLLLYFGLLLSLVLLARVL
jgi:hypothetical protein